MSDRLSLRSSTSLVSSHVATLQTLSNNGLYKFTFYLLTYLLTYLLSKSNRAVCATYSINEAFERKKLMFGTPMHLYARSAMCSERK